MCIPYDSTYLTLENEIKLYKADQWLPVNVGRERGTIQEYENLLE